MSEQAVSSGMHTGALLRLAREELGWSVTDVSERLKYKPAQIEAIEAGRYAELHSRAVVRGFVRSYARLVGCDADALLAALDREMPEEKQAVFPQEAQRPELKIKRSSRMPWRWLMGLLMLAVLVAGGWWLKAWLEKSPLLKRPSPENHLLMESPSERSASAASASVASSASATVSRQPLELRFSGDSWVEIKDAQGRQVFSGLGHAGQTESLAGEQPFKVKIGLVSAVSLRFNGQPVDLKPYTVGEKARLTLPLPASAAQ